MHIGLDGRILAVPRCGIGTYTAQLACKLALLPEVERITVFADQPVHPCYREALSDKRIAVALFGSDKKLKKKWVDLLLPSELEKSGADIYHATWNNSVPARRTCPCVLTIHDLAPWILPGHFRNWRKALRYKWQHFISAHRADMIITDSDASRGDIVRLCRVRSEKVRTIYLGYEQVAAVDESDDVLSGYGLSAGKYLIDPIGIDHPRRNPLLVVYGFVKWLEVSGSDFKLVFTGTYSEHSTEYLRLAQAIKECGAEGRVVLTGWVPDSAMRALMRNACLSVIPSFYEGFCLPLLESFAAGVPVIATDRGSIPEIAGGAAALINPYEFDALAMAIDRMLNDKPYRDGFLAKAGKRLAEFSWERTAALTFGVYEEVLNKNNR